MVDRIDQAEVAVRLKRAADARQRYEVAFATAQRTLRPADKDAAMSTAMGYVAIQDGIIAWLIRVIDGKPYVGTEGDKASEPPIAATVDEGPGIA